MNIENIKILAQRLESLGFENPGYLLLKRICFKPDSFLLSQKIEKGKDLLAFNLFFEKDNKQAAYVLMYYDATLQKETALHDIVINGINIISLDKSMDEIDWKTAFDFTTKKQFKSEDETSWEKEQKVESVIDSLLELEKSEDGKAVSIGLKLKYWTGMPYQELFGNISPLKNKSEVCQRFYFFNGESGISVDEAYRFLQNRWLERQIQAKRKQANAEENSETENDSLPPSGNGLLKKKRLAGAKGANSNKPILH